jgi:hypothetical protein
MKPDTARRLRWNRVGLAIGMGLILLAALGEVLGWWRDWGLVLAAVGIVLTAWYGIDTASETTGGRLEEPIETMTGHLATVRAVLERSDVTLARIEGLLRERR